MKKQNKKIFIFISSFIFFSGFSFANETIPEPKIDSNDPCTVFLCMAGKVVGENSSQCSAPQKKFFSIVAKKHGHFNGGRTSNARSGFIGQCKSADPSMISKIISKFGSLR